jgi:Ferritin-like domain
VLELGLLGPQATPVIARIRGHEDAHVAAIKAVLGGPSPRGPATVAEADVELKERHTSGRLTGLKSERAVLDFLYTVESLNIGAHDQALATLSEPRLVGLSAEIMAVEAQHAAAIGALLHPGNFDRIVPVNYVKGKS